MVTGDLKSWTFTTSCGEMVASLVEIKERGHRPTLDESLAFREAGYWQSQEDDVATLTYPYLYRVELIGREGYENAQLITGTDGDRERVEVVSRYCGHRRMIWTTFGVLIFPGEEL